MSTRCYYVLESADFESPNFRDNAIAALSRSQSETFAVEELQIRAWETELEVLREANGVLNDCTVAMEYMIPRMGKRIDAVLLYGGIVFALEFKVGEKSYPQNALDQVSDYAFDLKNFHFGSHDRIIVPILVCTKAPDKLSTFEERHKGVFEPICCNASNLSTTLKKISTEIGMQAELDAFVWIDSEYSPTPTIVEAAQALYESNRVEDISRHEADCTDINATTSCIDRIIEHSKLNNRKSICFITGVPGAGKTLVGLNIAAQRRVSSGIDNRDLAVFLSGNGPLIEVLQVSLTNDQVQRDEEACSLCSHARNKKICLGCSHYRTKEEIKSEVKTFIQGVHLFRDELFKSDLPPAEHIAVFDESQRAWSRKQMDKKAKTGWIKKTSPGKSEPQCLIEYMSRLPDWAVMVCLVGGGQEIHDGEAGITEWFNVLRKGFHNWDVYASPAIFGTHYLGAAEDVVNSIRLVEELHLGVDMRSYRNKNVAALAEAIVECRPDEASTLYEQIQQNYPVFVTRDLEKAKDWVRSQTKRPSDRYGIIADSHGARIRADGITVPTTDFNAATWFLAGKSDIDSSYFMEIAASEFKIQGLEIDYAVVAWEADYRYEDSVFGYHRFRGGKWQNVNDPVQRRYLANGYRVLLTRSRQGFVIYVPTGNVHDPTRLPEWYDGTFNYLRSIGIQEL